MAGLVWCRYFNLTSKDVKNIIGHSLTGQLVLLLLVGALGFFIYYFSPYLFPGLYDDSVPSSIPDTPTSINNEASPSQTISQSPSPPGTSSPDVENALELPEEISEVTLSEEIVTVKYTWIYGNSDWAWKLDIPLSGIAGLIYMFHIRTVEYPASMPSRCCRISRYI